MIDPDRCLHPYIIKRPESGPGARSVERPGEWFCDICPATWDTADEVREALSK